MTKQFFKNAIILEDGTGQPRNFYSIQVLRAVAALSVLLFHEKILTIGYGGVDIFFVISGFVMGTIGTKDHPIDFIGKRLIRIVPLYWSVTIALCLLSLIPGAFQTFSFDSRTLSRSLLFIPYLDQTDHVWPLVVAGWTLNYEMFFYAIFTLGLALGHPKLLPSLVMIALVVLGRLTHPNGPGPQTFTDPLLLEFTAGLALSQMPFLRGFWLGLGMLVGGALLFIAATVTGVPEGQPFVRMLCLGVPAFALVTGCVTLERTGRWPRLRPLEGVGDASYSLYLTHGVVIAFAHKFVHLPVILDHLAVIGISLGVALLSYHLFERPVARLLRRPGHQRPMLPIKSS